ncbi:MAG: response regulator, partial [Gammaproteobacteria bacterium]|nr:response regulator [Gammaproteobacteria bacterium]
YAIKQKIEQIEHGILITLSIILLSIFIIIRVNAAITQPIKSLTRTVRHISSGDLDTHVEVSSAGELGILESCINQMKHELKESQTDLELQLNIFTNELQQTLEELEIRNAELDITRSKAIYANNAKSEFLANMSHEIRTPLSGIIGFTELLRDTQLSGQQQDYTHTIQKSAKTLLEIINDILDLSKIESGKTEITKSDFNLVDLIEDIINLLSPTALDKNIELFYCIEKGVSTIIHSDHFRIHQIIINLISNAIKFTDKGYVYLQVKSSSNKSNESSILFNVSDTGIGLNNEDRKKLFNAFTQADTSITRRFGGTGLGLVISRKLTMLMKGEIGFDSKEGKGSTFWFCIPVTATQEEYKKPELADKKIAFICDHIIAKQSFKTLLVNQQCEVNDYSLNDLAILSDIEKDNDISIVFLGLEDINNDSINKKINGLSFTKPSLLIASTRSHTKLRSIQQHIFYSACFTSDKTEIIKQKIINAININEKHLDNAGPTEDVISSLDWSSINILVVDDNEINLRLAEIILHKHKARVTIARSGAQALEYARMNSFDIIFMDLHMPGLDGYETTRKIRDITPGEQPVIIALTANALPQEKEKAIHSGMNGILIKPVSATMLQKVINQWVLKGEATPSTLNSSTTNDLVNDSNDNNSATFSIELAKKFTSGNEELAYELFNMLRNELHNYQQRISTAVENTDLNSLREQVHKLNGASRC